MEYPEVVNGVCEYDSLRDDVFRLTKRFLDLEKEVKIYYVRFLPHGLLSLANSHGLKYAIKYLQKSIEIFKGWLERRAKE